MDDQGMVHLTSRRGGGMSMNEVVTASEIHATLDVYGAPAGDTVQERLRGWEQRERGLRYLAARVLAWDREGRPQALAHLIVEAAKDA